MKPAQSVDLDETGATLDHQVHDDRGRQADQRPLTRSTSTPYAHYWRWRTTRRSLPTPVGAYSAVVTDAGSSRRTPRRIHEGRDNPASFVWRKSNTAGAMSSSEAGDHRSAIGRSACRQTDRAAQGLPQRASAHRGAGSGHGVAGRLEGKMICHLVGRACPRLRAARTIRYSSGRASINSSSRMPSQVAPWSSPAMAATARREMEACSAPDCASSAISSILLVGRLRRLRRLPSFSAIPRQPEPTFRPSVLASP